MDRDLNFEKLYEVRIRIFIKFVNKKSLNDCVFLYFRKFAGISFLYESSPPLP
jgi:hypothetical protein